MLKVDMIEKIPVLARDVPGFSWPVESIDIIAVFGDFASTIGFVAEESPK